MSWIRTHDPNKYMKKSDWLWHHFRSLVSCLKCFNLIGCHWVPTIYGWPPRGGRILFCSYCDVTCEVQASNAIIWLCEGEKCLNKTSSFDSYEIILFSLLIYRAITYYFQSQLYQAKPLKRAVKSLLWFFLKKYKWIVTNWTRFLKIFRVYCINSDFFCVCVGIVDWKSVSPDVRKSYRVEFELTRCDGCRCIYKNHHWILWPWKEGGLHSVLFRQWLRWLLFYGLLLQHEWMNGLFFLLELANWNWKLNKCFSG